MVITGDVAREIVMNLSLPILLVLMDLLGLHVSELAHANSEVSPSKQAYPFVASATVAITYPSTLLSCSACHSMDEHLELKAEPHLELNMDQHDRYLRPASPLSQRLKDLNQQEVEQFGAWMRFFDPLREFFAGSVATLIRSSV